VAKGAVNSTGAAGEELADDPNANGVLVIPKAEEDPNVAGDAIVAVEGVIVLLPNKLEPATADAGVTVGGSEGGGLPKLNKLASFVETGAVD